MEIYAKDIKKPKASVFCNIKVFVLCHGLLQLTQLLYSSYFKSTITTIERRFGLNSFSSGTISSLHEVSNTVLIVFVSYLGSRVHRPRFIGLGSLLMSVSALILALPHFLSQPYKFDSVNDADGRDLCVPHYNSSSAESCGKDDAKRLVDTSSLWLLMATAQLLFGIGSVPIQPFGISYIDDFAGPGNSPLYIAILFAVSVFGPAFGYLLGSVMLRVYVDVDRLNTGANMKELTPSDPRWVGAWWMGLLVSSAGLALTSIPYFFFPRSMPCENGLGVGDDIMGDDSKRADGSMLPFLKMFPRLFVRLLLSPLFLLLVLTQCCFSSVVAGLATFLNKFLERQYSASPSYGSLLIGAVNLPSMAVGMLLGGVIMKRTGMSLRVIPRFSVAMLIISVLLCVPLFFMGCSTQTISGVYPTAQPTGPVCYSDCSCASSAFNPVCGSNGVEYISPCYAGCSNYTKHPDNSSRVQAYTNCSCIGGGSARPGSCGNSCPHFLLPVMFIISLAALVASLTHNPIYMMVLRTVPQEEKSFAIGVQFLLMRVLAWLPAPALFGMTIDSTCIWWKQVCGRRLGCGYYDSNFLRNRYLGLQVGFKVMGITLLAIVGWKVQRTREYNLEKCPEGPL